MLLRLPTILSSFLLLLETRTALSYPTPQWSDFSRPEGSVNAVYDLIERVLGDTSLKDAFHLSIVQDDAPWFRLEQQQQTSVNDNTTTTNNVIFVTATSASELTAGLGYYFKEYCNFTLEWSTGGRAGGSHIVIPQDWPVPLYHGNRSISVAVEKQRTVPWSYLMNVCTHSYSLVWYDWTAWQSLIDNLALRGINMILALTGQEEIQYQVFSELGVQDEEIRFWFNGPAFLTWSRGQNEYGSGIAGPLPRSFMKSQWHLQRERILPRLRSLGIVGILPAFQGNVPIQIKTLFDDSNITQQGETGWVDSLDPLFGRIADLWMTRLMQDFGTDHYYQLDGYFNGGTAPWLQPQDKPSEKTEQSSTRKRRLSKTAIAESQAITQQPPSHNADWYRRGCAAYTGLSRTDPEAYWMYQGFAFVGWKTDEEASHLKGFIDSAPPGKFVVIDMGYTPDGEWQKWNNSSFFGAPFIWTKLYNFGDTDGMRGDLHHINEAFPNQAIAADSTIVGIGSTPEGIDHNPTYFDLLYEQSFRAAPVKDLLGYLVAVAHKRYGLDKTNHAVAAAWKHLLRSSYSQEFSVQDKTAVAHLDPAESGSLFEKDRKTPKPILCEMFWSWKQLTWAATDMDVGTEPFVYDLVNAGREVLAQLSTPMALNFSDARSRDVMDRTELMRTGQVYIDLLEDLDFLLSKSKALGLNHWVDSAQRLAEVDAAGGVQHDCFSPILNNSGCCRHFFEWNAKCQVTTWNPTASNATKVPGGPIDYAAKHWSGLVKQYYAERARILLKQALDDEKHQRELNQTEIERLFARHAFAWTTSLSDLSSQAPDLPRAASAFEHAVATTKEVLEKYSSWFSSCDENHRVARSKH